MVFLLSDRPLSVPSIDTVGIGTEYLTVIETHGFPPRYDVLVRLLQDITLGAYSKIDSKFIMNGLGLGKSSL